MTSTLSLQLVGALAAGGLLTAGVVATAPASAAPPTRASTTAAATSASPAIRSLTVDVSKGVVTMPSRLLAGTYYVHVTTRNTDASLQVVRQPAGLSLAAWYAREVACRTYSSGESMDVSRRQCRYWRTSATFVGGATVVTSSPYDTLLNPGGRATFAITLSPGQYWFYEAQYGHPYAGRGPLPRSAVRVVTVVGPAERVTVPVAAVARFTLNAPTMPRVIPRRGFVLGLGEPGVITFLDLFHLKPGVTDADLVPGQCFHDGGGAYQALRCFDRFVQLGGGVSAGASALWWYDLPPGEYIAFQGGLNEADDTGLDPTPKFARVTVQ